MGYTITASMERGMRCGSFSNNLSILCMLRLFIPHVYTNFVLWLMSPAFLYLYVWTSHPQPHNPSKCRQKWFPICLSCLLVSYLLQRSKFLHLDLSLGVHNSWCYGNYAVNDHWNVYLFIFNTFVILKVIFMSEMERTIKTPYAVKPWADQWHDVQCNSNPTFLSV